MKTGSADEGIRLDGNLYWQNLAWTHQGQQCSQILVRDWNTKSTKESNRYCGLAAARATHPSWEAHGLEADPLFMDASFQSPVDTPRHDSPAVDPPVTATPRAWPDETVLLANSADRGAIELTEKVELTSIEPRVVPTSGGSFVVIRGKGFDARTRIEIGGRPINLPELVSTTTIFGRIPTDLAHPGLVTITAIKGEESSVLIDGLRLVGQSNTTPARSK